TFKEVCCPRTSTGHTIAVPANVMMKSRRLIGHVPQCEENAASISALRSAFPTEDVAPQLACSGELRSGVNFPRTCKHLLTGDVIPFSDIAPCPTRTEQVCQARTWPAHISMPESRCGGARSRA